MFPDWLSNIEGDPDFPDGMPAELIAALDQEEATERDNPSIYIDKESK